MYYSVSFLPGVSSFIAVNHVHSLSLWTSPPIFAISPKASAQGLRGLLHSLISAKKNFLQGKFKKREREKKKEKHYVPKYKLGSGFCIIQFHLNPSHDTRWSLFSRHCPRLKKHCWHLVNTRSWKTTNPTQCFGNPCLRIFTSGHETPPPPADAHTYSLTHSF